MPVEAPRRQELDSRGNKYTGWMAEKLGNATNAQWVFWTERSPGEGLFGENKATGK